MSRGLRFLLIITLLITSGCYLNTSVTDLNPKSDSGSDGPDPKFKIEANQASEFVSGSNQYEMTLIRRYKILSSSGSYNRELVNQTPKGYKVYSSVQGALISSQEGVR